MLSRTFTAGEKSLPGFQASKDKLTLLIGANATGGSEVKPLPTRQETRV